MKTMIIRMYGVYLNMLGLLFPKNAGRIGFLLFCRPLRLALTDKHHEFFNSAEKFTLDLEGNLIQGYCWGNGAKKVLFLHGWQSHSYRWKAYIETLSKEEYTVYALDAPGHGLSGGDFLSVPLYSSLIEYFIREKGPIHAITAHSLGGFSLLYTFYKFPLLPVNKIILMAPPGEARDFIAVFKNTLKISNRTMKLIRNYFISTYDVAPEYFSTSKFAASVHVQGIIIHDEEDKEAPYHYSLPLNKVWKRSKLVTTRGLGHNLRSTTVVKEVADFIQEPVYQEAVV